MQSSELLWKTYPVIIGLYLRFFFSIYLKTEPVISLEAILADPVETTWTKTDKASDLSSVKILVIQPERLSIRTLANCINSCKILLKLIVNVLNM